MSTSFEVYPGSSYVPTYSELLDLSTQRINDFLKSRKIRKTVHIDVKILQHKNNLEHTFQQSDRVIWEHDFYSFFMINGVCGGTDVYFKNIDGFNTEIWKELIEENSRAQQLREIILKSINIGYYWTFRRSAGQSGIVNLSYGLIAASLAELTKGFIYSDDGAWDFNCFPTLPCEFFEWYFKPETARIETDREWSSRCIALIKKELK